MLTDEDIVNEIPSNLNTVVSLSIKKFSIALQLNFYLLIEK